MAGAEREEDVAAAPPESCCVGLMLGCALGDAIGYPHEGAPAEQAAAAAAAMDADVASIAKNPDYGQYTDDTQSTRTLVQSIIACGGAFSPPDFMGRLGRLAAHGGILGMGGTTKSSLERFLGGTPWQEAAAGLVRPSNGSAMRTGPIGLLHWREENAASCARDARLQSQVTHKDPLSQSGAVAVSLAVAHACRSAGADFPVAKLAADLTAYAVHVEPPLDLGELLLRMHAAPSMDAAFAMLPREPATYVTSTSAWPIGTYVTRAVMWSLYTFVRTPHDFWCTVSNAIRVGGDTDTVAAMAGAISGAFNGPEGIYNCDHTAAGAVAVINRLSDASAPEGAPKDAGQLMQLGRDLRRAIIQRSVAARRRRTLGGLAAVAAVACVVLPWLGGRN
uniref:ADP-ribosylhydrolase ARH3 n=1 Tax=Bicosoecida sp. CB-2014 TaxID=1486930 RepID=A0A7S1C5R7_9STRA